MNTKTIRILIAKLIAVICISILINLIIDEWFYINIYNTFYLSSIKTTLISIMLIMSIICVLYGISNSIFSSTIVISIVTFIFNIVNIIKIGYTETPILFTDFDFLKNSGELYELVCNNLGLVLYEKINYIVILFIVLVMVCMISLLISKLIKDKNTKYRVILPIVGILILFTLFLPNIYITKYIVNVFYNTETIENRQAVSTCIYYYAKYGVVSGMYGQLLENRGLEPIGYDESKLDVLLEDVSEEENLWGTPNIIVVFSEAFWDISKLDDVEFNTDVTYNFNKLKQQGVLVNLVSPTYGGLSANVDFELLTGGSLRYFGYGYVPIEQIYNKKENKEVPSIVKELNNNEYHTKIVFGKDYYSMQTELEKIGFKEYIEIQQTKEITKGRFVSDEYLTNLIINELNEKKDGEKLFYMSETIQNHMPYLVGKYENYKISILRSNYSSDVNNTVLSYAQGVYDADKQLGRLYEYVQNYDEPTIILFMGDHLPYLRTSTRNRCNVTNKLF